MNGSAWLLLIINGSIETTLHILSARFLLAGFQNVERR